VTSGPIAKMNSSTTLSSANALRSRSASGAACAQRARTIEPIAGWQAPATITAAAWAPMGHPYSTVPTKATSASALPRASHGSRRCWPTRSIQRLLTMAPTAAETWKAAERKPARAYDPVVVLMNRTMPRPTIAMGSRATKPVRENCHAPGRASARR